MTAGSALRAGADAPWAPGGVAPAAALPVIGVFLVVLVAWEVVLGALGIQQFLIPRPSVIAAALVDQWPILQRGVIYTATEALGVSSSERSLGLRAALATSRWTTAPRVAAAGRHRRELDPDHRVRADRQQLVFS